MKNNRSDRRATEDEVLQKLPLTITDITVQKSNPYRVSLFHNGDFLTGVSRQTLGDFSLCEGTELTPSLFEKIRKAETCRAIREASLRYLGRRDHATAELRKKLTQKGFGPAEIDIVLNDLAAKKYIDDEAFARKYASEKAGMNRWGPKKIKAALLKKGLPLPVIEPALKNVTENLQQEQICVDLVIKRKRHFLRETDPWKRKQKIYHFLAGRGFSGAVIASSFSQIKAEFNA